jgi:mannan endo-1,4-beta-mannosidase
MRRVRIRWLVPGAALLAVTVSGVVVAGNAGAAVQAPAAVAATAPGSPATRTDLINYFQSISGHYTLSGQQDGPSSAPNTWQQQVHNITGKYPGMWAGDFAFEQADINARPTVIAQAKSIWAAGSIPALVWHACPPTTVGQACHWSDNPGVPAITGYQLTSDQWSQLITDGTALNTAWKRRLDESVPYFQDLKNNGIPVLFRPQHEMNEAWSWWGGRPGPNGSLKLYQITHDYLVNVKGLTNIVWVWNLKDIAGGAAHVSDYWPGASYVDLATMDAWDNYQPTQEWYNAMLGIAGGKPIALSEVGQVPTPATLAAQPKWTFFSVWINWLTDPAWNTNAGIQATYNDPQVLSRGSIHIPVAGSGGTPPPTTPPAGNPGAITGIGGKCVDVAGANSANGTAIQLYTCNGTSAQQWTINLSTDGTLRALGKCMDVTAAGTANGTKVQLYDCNGTGAQKWTASNGRLINTNSGRCLDATGQSSADGTRLQIWDCTGNPNQTWTLPS